MRSGIDQIIPAGVVFTQACVNIDEFWLNEVKNRGFTKETNLEDFIKLIEEASVFRYPLNTRRMDLFEATQTTDDPLDYIRDLTNLIRSADWATLSKEKTICQFFLNVVKCEERGIQISS